MITDLSIVIVNWNTRDLLRACLAALRAAVGGLSYEVIVVDNGSTDGSAAMVGRDFPEVLLLDAGANLGFEATLWAAADKLPESGKLKSLHGRFASQGTATS